MRILYLNYVWDPHKSSGARTHIRELTRGLSALGHTVVVEHRHRIAEAARGSLGQGTSAPARRRARLRHSLAPYLHESACLIRAFRGLVAERKLMQKEKPDVVLTRTSLHQFSSLVAARRCGVPIVFEVDAPVGYEYRKYSDHYFLIPGFAEWLESRMLSGADGLFVVSNPLKKHFVGRGVPEHKIRVVPNGVDISRFRPEAGDPEIRERFGAKSVILGFVGSFARFHGIDQLREAIDFLAPIRPNTCFLMVGGGKLSDKVREHCLQRGLSSRVHFTGHVPAEEVPGLMAAADVLIAPYEAQDFFYFSPIKVFEYMAAGRAIVAARIGQIQEIIRDQVDGILYDPSIPGALGKQLLDLVDRPALRSRLGQAARRTAEQEYTWQASAEGVAALLEQVVQRRRAAAR